MFARRIVKNYDRLAILDPNRSDNDISGGSNQVVTIFERMSRAHEEILNAMSSRNRKSLLDWLLGGDYNNFLWQRRHLKELFRKRFGDLELVEE